MVANQSGRISKWRPHHIHCEPFFAINFPDRGENFIQIEHKIKETMRTGTDTLIEVIEGVDELCQACPLCQDNRCHSPNGDENAVRKWDAVILKGLGISYGQKMSAQKFRLLIKEKAPMAFCINKCRWRDNCTLLD